MQLPEDIFVKIVSVINSGKAEYNKADFEKSIEYYQEAENLFPEPATEYSGAEQLYILLGDSCLQLKQYEKAKEYYLKSQDCIDKYQLYTSDFKLGKIYFKEESYEKAKIHFQKIPTGKQKDLLYNENPEYYELIIPQKEKASEDKKLKDSYKTYKGKVYTKEEWLEFEQKQFEKYARKNNLLLEEKKKPNTGKFFLDEKDSLF